MSIGTRPARAAHHQHVPLVDLDGCAFRHGSRTVILVRDTLPDAERTLLNDHLSRAFAPGSPDGWVVIERGTAAAVLAARRVEDRTEED